MKSLSNNRKDSFCGVCYSEARLLRISEVILGKKKKQLIMHTHSRILERKEINHKTLLISEVCTVGLLKICTRLFSFSPSFCLSLSVSPDITLPFVSDNANYDKMFCPN